MSDPCLFCDMLEGDEDHVPVYEDEDLLAVMDPHPINPGHLLVFPREHISDFYLMEDGDYDQLMRVSRDLAEILDYLYEPEKVGLLIAGFEIAHVHVHLVPMHVFHDITSKKILEGQRGSPTRLKLEQEADQIRGVIETPGEDDEEA